MITSINEAYEKFRGLYEKIRAYRHALSLLYTDGVTAAPLGAAEGRGKTSGILSELEYNLHTSPVMKESVAYLIAHKDKLTPFQNREISEYNRANEYIGSIPADEYVEYSMMINKAESVWHKAKHDNDFASFAPYLEKIFASVKRFALYYKPDEDPYDTLLGMYERGMTQKSADEFFLTLREKIVPLINRVVKAPEIDNSFIYRHYPVEAQRRFSDYLLQTIGIDREYCSIAETEHPFTNNFNKHDVRVTTHYHENNLLSSMYSVIHEGGHALYELGSGDEYEGTCLSGGVSMGIHESQSRLFENIIGRSREYINLIFPYAKELFAEQLADVDSHAFWLAVNKSEPSLIRTEADELTYSLHIMVRYELEKEIISGKLSVYDLPAVWAEKYRKYLGIEVPDDTHGVLQDSHWSGGMVGYFPSYALGSAYGAEIMAAMRRDIDVDDIIRCGRIKEIVAWLTEKIYRHGCMFDPSVLMEKTCNEPLKPQYFIDYLEKKYNEIITDISYQRSGGK